mmetsp:Transcript_23786/g.76653  ORF Transcript_23786/g.76653 Transcript_23786/m.76653 type:complete len:1297 (-) Transcript_23786:116-4006(-)
MKDLAQMDCMMSTRADVNFLALICEFTYLDSLFKGLQAAVGAHLADTMLSFLLAPLYYVLPFFAESLLFYLQYCVFMVLPLLLLALGCSLEYLKSEIDFASWITASGFTTHSCLPDAMFSSTLSGMNIHLWLDTLPWVSKYLLCMATAMYFILFLFLLETNFFRDAWPLMLQSTFRKFFNQAGEALVHMCLWCLLFFVCMTGLWFMMAVVIYPEQMMVALSGVGGLGFIAFSMFTRYRASKEQITLFLKQEVPDILDLVCDNFLREFDRQDLAGPSQNRNRLGQKVAEVARVEMRKYVDKRFNLVQLAQLSGGQAGDYQKMDTNTLFRQIFDRALLKAESWSALGPQSERPAGGALGALSSALGLKKGGDEGPQTQAHQVKTTEQILIESGLQQEDTSDMEHFTMRVRISDRETELRDKSVHSYSEDQRQKLMNVFVRCLEGLPMAADVEDVLEDPKMLGRAIYRAQKSKMEVFNRARLKDGLADAGSLVPAVSKKSATDSAQKISLLELFISDVNQQELKKYEFYIARYLDDVLDSTNIAESIASFVWRESPLEIKKQLRLTLDEHCVGSSMQRVFEDLRRWKSSVMKQSGDAGLRASLTLKKAPEGGEQSTGLLQMLEQIQVIDRSASADYRRLVWKMLERKVNEWKDEEETEYVISPNELENFVRELLSGQLWWGALVELLRRIGFPIDLDGGGSPNTLPVAIVREEFELFLPVQKKGGLLSREKVPDFLFAVTRADGTDGGCGRIWKAQMIKLMQKLQICGHVNVPQQGAERSSKGTSKKALSRNDQQAETLNDLAQYGWPDWLQRAWNSKARDWVRKDGSSVGAICPFIPKKELYGFLQEIAFKTDTQKPDNKAFQGSKVDDDYDDWRKVKDGDGYVNAIWNLRGKALLELRGVWQECFFHILADMSNEVTDKQKGLILFEICRQDQLKFYGQHAQYRDANRDGLLHVNFLFHWLRENLVQNTGECSLQVLQKVLERCELTLPRIVVTSLYHSAKPTDNFNDSWNLRKVSDLEDRIVMYLVKGLPAESVEALIFDVLSVPSLQDIGKAELKFIFQQVDTKLGTNGFLEPREIRALITFLGQAGMSLADLLKSLKTLGCDFPELKIKEAFLLLDTSGDDLMDLPEFLGLMDYVIVRLIPQEIMRVMGLEPQQVILRLVVAVLTLLSVFLFVFVSLGAFHVEIAVDSDSSGSAATMIRTGIALLAVVALKRDGSEEDEERFFKDARERLYAMMGVTHSQIDARRRAMGYSAGGVPQVSGMTAGKGGMGQIKLLKGRPADEGDDGDDGDDGGDD